MKIKKQESAIEVEKQICEIINSGSIPEVMAHKIVEECVIQDNRRELLKFVKFADKSPHLLLFDVLSEYLSQNK